MTKIIAELSSNHGGDLCRCLDMIVAAKKAGCWAAKFQLYSETDLPDFDPKANCPVPLGWVPHMFAVAKAHEFILFASIFSGWAIRILKAHCNIFKIASPESTRLKDHDYRGLQRELPYAARVFVSSGMADFHEMRRIFYNREMLYCKAGYPATITALDIAFMKTNALGFSDHTEGMIAALAMAGAGAQYIEKHFKLDDNCVDAAFSLNPEQMKTLCDLAK